MNFNSRIVPNEMGGLVASKSLYGWGIWVGNQMMFVWRSGGSAQEGERHTHQCPLANRALVNSIEYKKMNIAASSTSSGFTSSGYYTAYVSTDRKSEILHLG